MEHAQYILIANYGLKQIDIYVNIDINSCSPSHDFNNQSIFQNV